MFIEYKEGEKHTGMINKSDCSETAEAFTDCGQLIEENEVVIDIDHLPKESIREMIKEFNIQTETVWTDRGVHLWFKKPVWFLKRKDGICKLAFEVEQHTKGSNPGGLTIKRNGVLRTIENQGARQYMPEIFAIGTGKNKYENLTGLNEGDGRNSKLFYHRRALKDCKDFEKILKFINYWVFDEPMKEEEFTTITRDMDLESDPSDRCFTANHIIEEFRTVIYSGQIWWFDGTQYLTDAKNTRLKRLVYEKCPDQETKYIDEVIKQIEYKAPLIDEEKAFPIKFKNGVLLDGRFIPFDNYKEFTPYYIDIEYEPNAEPVEEVDHYIDAITSSDANYRDLLMEVIGYVMITDVGRIRSLGKFFMFRGDGANGKGTLLQIMKAIYNQKNCTYLSIKQLTDDRFKVTMIGKLANLGDDIEATAIDDEQLKVLKNISTADTVATRHLYSESEAGTFRIKLYFTTNTDIKSFEKGYAYKRRIVWLPMFNKVEKPDPNFITKMTTEKALKYWIRLIVEGYKRLYTNKVWTDCPLVDEYNDQYHENNNVCLQFAKEIDPDEEIVGKTISQIREDFNGWVSDERKFSSKLFQAAVWDLYGIGLGVKKVVGKSKRVFMKQSETDQKLQH